jgi:hypothetical protein
VLSGKKVLPEGKMLILVFLAGLVAGMAVGIALISLASLAQHREEEIQKFFRLKPGCSCAPDSYFSSTSFEVQEVQPEA